MNRLQNTDRKNKDKKIKELEIENSLLRQKLEMVAGIVGGSVNRIEMPAVKDGRAIATIGEVKGDLFIQSKSSADRAFLEERVELRKDKEKVESSEIKKEEEKKKEDSIVDHFKQ